MKLVERKYTSNSWKRCVLEVDLQYPKKLRELYNDYPFPPFAALLLKFTTLFQARIKSKEKIHLVLEFNPSRWLKPHIEFNTQKEQKKKKNKKDGKGLCKLMSTIYEKNNGKLKK